MAAAKWLIFTTVTVLLLVTINDAKPTTKDQLDKVTVNDVAVNAVVAPAAPAPSDATQVAVATATAADKKDNAATVQITGITTGATGSDDFNNGGIPLQGQQDDGLFKPQKAGSMFARFIDDIFQIPISVLQNVARLITSPFIQKKTPGAEAASS